MDESVPSLLDLLRATLDGLGARRRIMPVVGEFGRVQDVAVEAGLTHQDAVQPVLLDVDRDFAAALVPGGCRLSPGRIAALIGARHVRLLGPQQTRRWLARRIGRVPEPSTGPLAWWEVPFLTGLPTIVAREIARRDFVIVPIGEPGWVVRLRPEELTRITNGHVGAITNTGGEPAVSAP